MSDKVIRPDPNDEVAFVLEALEANWGFRFRSKKLGVDFWLVKRVTQIPENEVGFTLAEFIAISKLPDPEAVIRAKIQFLGSKIKETVYSGPQRPQTP